MFDGLKGLFSAERRQARLQARLDKIRQRLPVPVFWLFGKTQSGKTSVIKYLTGADQAQIGSGFQPCTRFSRRYEFPTPEAPLLTFLDTRGLDEPGYDPAEDLAQFNDAAHVVLVTVKALDHAQENVLTHLRALRKAQPDRPVVLLLTCLHEAYPQQQHPLPCPFDDAWEKAPDFELRSAEVGAPSTGNGESQAALPPQPVIRDAKIDALIRSLAEQRRRFAGLIDRVAAVDLTPAEEGFADPEYGGPRLHQVLLEVLPAALRQSLLMLDEARQDLEDHFSRQALPFIVGYSSLAASAGAVPVPILDVVLLGAVQTRMVYHLARLYGQPLTAKRFGEIAGTMGTSVLVRQAGRGLLKLIPGVGSVVGSLTCATLAGASTFALGKAFCYYYRAVHRGHVPQATDLRRYFHQQFLQAEEAFKTRTQFKDEG
jgi:uncharacterized protein (DUF697 family)